MSRHPPPGPAAPLELGWLRPPPPDLRAGISEIRGRLKAGAAGPADWQALRALSLHALDEPQLARLARLVDALPDGPGLPEPLRLALLGDGTLSLLGPAITATALRRGLRVRVIGTEYGTAMGEALDPGSALHAAAASAALVAPDRRMLGLDGFEPVAEAAAERVAAALGTLRGLVAGLRQSLSGPVLMQSVVPPALPFLGGFDRLHPGSPAAMVAALNAALADWAAGGDIVLVDIAALAGAWGLARWEDPQHWHGSKLPFSPDAIPLHAEWVVRTLAAARGLTAKCLVLDLDNTLWGGVIGDDGVDGLVLGQGSARGEAHLAVQRLALELRARGVLLAVASKNDDAVARRAFREHPDMLLREEHITVFQANWTDKAANLRAIAETLDIGLDALVFLDDNPAERAQVRAECPQVMVPELPEDPALYAPTLMATGYFDTTAFGAEDAGRAALYAGRAERLRLEATTSDMGAYLRSLDMVCTLRPFDAERRARIAQLINKSNQFNLTTRRRSEAEVAALTAAPGWFTLQARLADRFGDNGMIGVVIAEARGPDWVIDTWLMSCRVLKRRVEEAVLAVLAGAARAAGAERLTGRYIPTPKNALVRGHYPALGFTSGGPGATEGETLWHLDLAGWQPPDDLPMDIVDETGRH
ncbi:HAD-IIIC family phosphatase (plasmid) [Paroceanicella profunda]|uniref:HAD-IIIC family phosphatase n=1 Tax=Paroceanicella profunda TaxID=2579971 RepID=A0A5B8FJL1_9RHOB|nr:HAD-IIIC family phosphatase [Paroceanicella profunda]QDL94557.1 HAD-IIIC family phosphatase [Paroceanicella profunda]